MSFLGPLCPRLVLRRLGRQVLLAELLEDVLPSFGLGCFRHVNRVGAHVSDEAHPLTTADVLARIQRLGDGHRLFRGEAQFTAGLLLQGAGHERRGRAAADLAAGDLLHYIDRALQIIHDGLGIGLILQVRVLATDLEQPGDKALGLPLGLRLLLSQLRLDGPVLDRHEGLYLALPLTDQAQGDRLHPTGRQALTPHLVAQQRAEGKAHDTVQDAARLLGIDP